MLSASRATAPIHRITRLNGFVQRQIGSVNIRSLIRTAMVVGAACLLFRVLAATPALAARPIAARVTSVSVEPSVRRKQLGLSVEINGHLDAGTMSATGRLLDETGKEERQFTAEATCITADTQTVTFTGNLVGGGTVTQSFTFSQFGFLTFSFNSSFT